MRPMFVMGLLLFCAGLSERAIAAAQGTAATLPQLKAMTARFVPFDVRVDVSGLPANERTALVSMIEAAKIVDTLFLRQVSARNETLLLDLLKDDSELGRARLHYFLLNKRPWSELDDSRPFLPGIGPKSPAANFYPADASKEEVQKWMDSLSRADKEAATGFFTTIRRLPNGSLAAIPYSTEYQGELAEAARLLREAAAATTQPTLRDFLEKRARAFVSNDYFDSDMAWMALDSSIEPTIGPYEVYEDEWFNFKAAFEAFIVMTDIGETAKLGRFEAELQGLEDHLPIEPRFRRAKLGSTAPIRVGDVVFAAGDGNHGVQTAAFNLPNDERVVAAKGSKRVMLKNYQQAKFENVLVPISRVALSKKDQPLVSFDAFFTHILMHELMHGLGPQTVKVQGRESTVRKELKELNGQLEEAKADISGLWALQALIDKGVLPREQEKAFYTTFVASSFRTLRFGLEDAHAKGMALQMNWLMDQGAVTQAADGTFSVNFSKVKKSVAALTREIMTIQATGDYARARELLTRMVVIRPALQQVIDRLGQVPVDIEPRFVTAEELTRAP
jgi:hypothetical protein